MLSGSRWRGRRDACSSHQPAAPAAWGLLAESLRRQAITDFSFTSLFEPAVLQGVLAILTVPSLRSLSLMEFDLERAQWDSLIAAIARCPNLTKLWMCPDMHPEVVTDEVIAPLLPRVSHYDMFVLFEMDLSPAAVFAVAAALLCNRQSRIICSLGPANERFEDLFEEISANHDLRMLFSASLAATRAGQSPACPLTAAMALAGPLTRALLEGLDEGNGEDADDAHVVDEGDENNAADVNDVDEGESTAIADKLGPAAADKENGVERVSDEEDLKPPSDAAADGAGAAILIRYAGRCCDIALLFDVVLVGIVFDFRLAGFFSSLPQSLLR
eukprot:m.177448 g.177448  ORF g.177448 m.177448 type:complete len:330 (+) comp9971_c0_seq7:937-1926(+)